MPKKLTDDELAQAIADCETNATALEDQLEGLKAAKRETAGHLAELRAEQAARYRATLEDIPPAQGVGI